MSREIRRVPVNWKHPQKSYGTEHDYVQLLADYDSYLKYWQEDVEKFINHMNEVIETGETKIYDEKFTDPKKVYDYLMEDDALAPPNINDFMPKGEWYQLYQTVGEGSPLSPPFEKPEELVDWLSNNKDFWGHTWTASQAKAMVSKGYAMSGVVANGKFYTAEESVEL